MVTMEATDERVITSSDRCDKCSAQAYFLAVFDSGELYFCRHHFLKNEDAIREFAYHIVDESEILG